MNFKSFLESSESHLIQHLGNQLQQFNNKNYSILGHGTSNKTIAEKISQEGIKYHSPDLNRQALSLFDQNKPIQNQYDNLNTILNWPHKNSKFIVLIGIPNAPQHMRGGDAYFNSVWNQIPDDQLPTLSTDKYTIPPEYIIGYINANNANLHLNPTFNPKPISEIKDWFPTHIHKQRSIQHIPTPNTSNQNADVW